jgi:RimJ/RimL family protein N-acetyltransferase
VRSERLELVWLDATCLRALAEGRWSDASAAAGIAVTPAWGASVAGVAAYRLRQLAQTPEDAEWLLRALVRRSDGTVVGYLNFHGAPIEGVAELGYDVLEDHRRQGFASEAVTAAMSWARDVHGVHRFRLSIAPANEGSLAMAAALHFTHVGEQMDEEDGLELVFERELA